MAQDTTEIPDPTPPLSRRTVVAGAGLATIGVGLAAAGCAAPATPVTPAAPPAASGGTTAAVPTAAAPASASAGTVLGPASGVPVGGGAVFAAQKVVVTQATAGTYVGLSAVCTHQGCIVAKVADGTIDCACHGSRYKLDGTVAKGPARSPLAPVTVAVTGGSITLA